jgi:sugar/nucleoside kinase (ribokinase family)
MTANFRRLVSVGNVVIDIVARVPAFPDRGGDVLASAGGIAAGGGFNVMVAGARQRLPTAYAGTHGTGLFGDLARAALREEGISILQEPTAAVDTGFDVAVVDNDGERTFITVVGAEAQLTDERLDTIEVGPEDAVQVSGYGLLHPINRVSITNLLKRIPAECIVFFDPGPLVGDIPAEAMAAMVMRADWWSCNLREATIVTGQTDPVTAAAILANRNARGGVLVRLGRDGCILVESGASPHRVAGFTVDAVDTNGAGDAHTGAFIAALARGATPREAARLANACAAIAVTRPGPATGPTLTELQNFLDRNGAR